MTVELVPLGVACNIACSYCYQEPMRKGPGLPRKTYNIEKMKAAVRAEQDAFTVFGGEPLLVPLPDLIELWKFGLENWETLPQYKRRRSSRNGIQTNAALITPEHVQAFKDCDVHVGVSIDGPDELNDARRAGSLEKTRETTRQSIENFKLLLREKVPASLIVTLHALNARGGRLPMLLTWLRELSIYGLRYTGIHLLEDDGPKELLLSDDENVTALLALRELEIEGKMSFDLFRDIRALLTADDEQTSCTWNACDPLTTQAVRGVNGDGTMSNCGRVNKDGSNWIKAETPSHPRQLALYRTPWEEGGCKGCRFFFACKGQCPGTAIDGDWRNRTRDCQVWFRLMEETERDLLKVGIRPVSKRGDLQKIEQIMLGTWATGGNLSVKQAVALAEGRTAPAGDVDHGDAHGDGHGDNCEHGDSHGDHTDLAQPPHIDAGHGDVHGDAPHIDARH